jgi:multicomponent Na+:H+ antiporter subunit E
MIRFLLRCLSFLWLMIYFLWDLTLSSIQVAGAVLLPGNRTRPRLVTVPLKVESDVGITMVANFITLTPGTLSVDLSPNKKVLLVHSLLAGESSEETRGAVHDGIEARVLRVTGR